MKTLIVGAGQVGTALKEVLANYHEVHIKDLQDYPLKDVEVMHICYPEHTGFVKTTKNYIKQYKPRLTIINSSVSVGTTSKCGPDVVYSPVRGRHPSLAKEMTVFAKFSGCWNESKAIEATDYFNNSGWREAYAIDNPDALEYLKLMSNVHMGLEVAWRQEVNRMMKRFNVNGEHYDQWEQTYSDGYRNLGQWHLMRSRMNPGPIGGHCILPCTEILGSQFKSKAFDFILESNAKAS